MNCADGSLSDDVLDVVPVVGSAVGAVALVVAGGFPLPVKLVDFLHVLCADQLSDELELLPELEQTLLEDRHLPRGPVFEDSARGHWVDQDVQLPLSVQVVDCVEVELDRLLLLFGVAFEDVALGLYDLQDGFLLRPQALEQADVGVVFRLLAGPADVLVDLAKVWLFLSCFILEFVRFDFLARFCHVCCASCLFYMIVEGGLSKKFKGIILQRVLERYLDIVSKHCLALSFKTIRCAGAEGPP